MRLQSLSEDYQKLQQGASPAMGPPGEGTANTALAELQDTVASRQKLEGQKQENLGVQKVATGEPYAARWADEPAGI